MTISHKYPGGCHCGTIEVELLSGKLSVDFEVRECQCSFCRKHGTKAIADPDGLLVVKINDREQVNRYSFGLATADYILCRRCGVYVIAMTKNSDDLKGIVIVNALSNRVDFSSEPIAVIYDHESLPERLKRRQENWTPIKLIE